jgi:hypothetical protein
MTSCGNCLVKTKVIGVVRDVVVDIKRWMNLGGIGKKEMVKLTEFAKKVDIEWENYIVEVNYNWIL